MLQNSVAMVETAYLLIALDHNTPTAVARDVLRVPGVVEASVTMGELTSSPSPNRTIRRGFPESRQQCGASKGSARSSRAWW